MKDRNESRSKLSGLFNITVTPFQSDGSLDTAALAENIERVLVLGYDGVLIGGTYGEFATMTAVERAELFEAAVAVVADRVPVLLGTGDSDVRVVRELTRLAGRLGGVPMVTAPYVSEVTEAQIVAFFSEIAPLSSTGIVVYNAPGIGITLSPSVIDQLAELRDVVGVKQGDLDPTVVDILVGRVGGRLRLLCASDLTPFGPLASGFDGLSSTNSGALPELILAEYRAVRDGDLHLATALHRAWYPLRELAREHGQPQTTKAAMMLRGFNAGAVREPLRQLDASSLACVESALADIASHPAAGFDPGAIVRGGFRQ